MKPIMTQPFEEFYLNEIRENTLIYKWFPELEEHMFSGVSGWIRVYVFRKGKHMSEDRLQQSIDFLNQWKFEQKCVITNEQGTASLFENWDDDDYFRYVLIIDRDATKSKGVYPRKK